MSDQGDRADGDRPAISVVVPAHNAAATLADQLDALAGQDFSGRWELIVVDNGSTDGTGRIARERQREIPWLTVIEATDAAGASYARNAGAAAATASLLAFCDADDVAHPRWLSTLVTALADAPFVGGHYDPIKLNDPQLSRWRTAVPMRELPRPLGYLPFALTGNLGIDAEVFRAAGGFDPAYQYSEDADFGWRIQLAGHELRYAHDAVMHWRHRTGARRTAEQVFRFARSQAQLYKQYRDRGARRRSGREVATAYWYLLSRLPYLAGSNYRRGLWLVVAGANAGRLAGSVRYRVFFP